MKFFDLEMSSSLSFGKKGSRDVSYAMIDENGNCTALKYTHGFCWDECMANKYSDHSMTCTSPNYEFLIVR